MKGYPLNAVRSGYGPQPVVADIDLEACPVRDVHGLNEVMFGACGRLQLCLLLWDMGMSLPENPP